MWMKGQRVVAHFEQELGLGIIIEVHEGRQIEILFPIAEVRRRYAIRGAPLKRIILTAGQKARIKGGKTYTIVSSRDVNGLLMYQTDTEEFWEYELEHIVQENTPLAHLLAGNIDKPMNFDLRLKGWELIRKYSDPELQGFFGPKVSLLPHQFYVASEISKREFPRALLADEVGLGKTIEAGLIYSSLRAQGRAERVLVITPESLKHQWLTEMYRRFNEMFSVVDEERSEQEKKSQGQSAFEMNQKIICSLDFLLDSPDDLEDASQSFWDLLIVDEAHHLEWDEEDSSPQWDIIKLLSERARGVLLLTATPENHGAKTEFGLLHLVEPERFTSYKEFLEENAKMHKTAKLTQNILKEERDDKFIKTLEKEFSKDEDLLKAVEKYKDGGPPETLLKPLIDRHGTGRVLVRNRRSRLKGFPKRICHSHPIAPPKEWAERLKNIKLTELEDDKLMRMATGRERIISDSSLQFWFNARNKWLLEMLKNLNGEKALLICSSAKRAIDIQAWLRKETTAPTALFHEGLEIVERDRQAAWFAEAGGAKLLICSEIGGEGRNFQFVHHLILYDLPFHPDVLEQRIGRLDRIGQKETIKIHVPYFEDTPEEVIYKWFLEGVVSFESPWNGGDAMEEMKSEVLQTCRAFIPKSPQFEKRQTLLKKLIQKTQKSVEELKERMKESVDILVDLNSFDEEKGKRIVKKIETLENDGKLREFLELTFNHFGIDAEDLDGRGTLKLTAHNHSFIDHFPGIMKQSERTVTFKRSIALAREEINFLSWNHPITQGGVQLVLEGNTGRSSIALFNDGRKSGIELIFILRAIAPASLEVDQDLPPTPIRIFVNLDGEITEQSFTQDSKSLRSISPAYLKTTIEALKKNLPGQVDKATAYVEKKAKPILKNAVKTYLARLGAEHERLEALSKINPLITKRELDLHNEKIKLGIQAIDTALLHLDAMRVLLPSK